MLASKSTLDRFVGRLLFVETPAAPAIRPDKDERSERAFGFSLVFSGIRCILQYAILPFVLPVLGVTMDAAAPISLGINLLAIVLIVYSLRRFWKVGYRHRWRYLPVALTALVLLVAFIVLDLHVITTR
jgi:phosphoglycerol transferase MdoB-like AlkP superfamily enzyme